MKNIMASFRTIGIFPLDQNKVVSLVNPVISTESPVSKPGSLTYLPLLSPMPSPKQSLYLILTFQMLKSHFSLKGFKIIIKEMMIITICG